MSAVRFLCRCPETLDGESVFVVGGCNALGSWDPDRAVPLQTSSEDFPLWPLWVSEPVVLNFEGESFKFILEFKFIIKKTPSSSSPRRRERERWEPISGNRFVAVTQGQALEVVAGWGNVHSSVRSIYVPPAPVAVAAKAERGEGVKTPAELALRAEALETGPPSQFEQGSEAETERQQEPQEESPKTAREDPPTSPLMHQGRQIGETVDARPEEGGRTPFPLELHGGSEGSEGKTDEEEEQQQQKETGEVQLQPAPTEDPEHQEKEEDKDKDRELEEVAARVIVEAGGPAGQRRVHLSGPLFWISAVCFWLFFSLGVWFFSDLLLRAFKGEGTKTPSTNRPFSPSSSSSFVIPPLSPRSLSQTKVPQQPWRTWHPSSSSELVGSLLTSESPGSFLHPLAGTPLEFVRRRAEDDYRLWYDTLQCPANGPGGKGSRPPSVGVIVEKSEESCGGGRGSRTNDALLTAFMAVLESLAVNPFPVFLSDPQIEWYLRNAARTGGGGGGGG